METRRRMLLVSGSLRARSTNTAVLRTACAVAPADVRLVLYDGLAALPHFNPDHDGDAIPTAAADLREQIRVADALLFSVPEYAGSLPGSLKNLLDWSIGDDRPGSIYQKPVAWINVSPRGAAGAHEQLRQVLGYAHAAIIEPACSQIPAVGEMVDDETLIADATIRARIVATLSALTAHVGGSAEHTLG